MKKSLILFFVISAWFCSGAKVYEEELHGSIDFIYASKWMSKGVSVWGQQGGFYEAVNFKLWDTNFGAYTIHRHPTRNNSNRQRLDYGVYYQNKLFDGERYATDYRFRWHYEHYPNIARNRFATTQEWAFAFSWPELLECGIVPRYIAFYEYPAGSGYANSDVTGWGHLFELRYPMNASVLAEEFGDQKVNLIGRIFYNDGLGRNKDHDWSHVTLGATTTFELNKDWSLIPSLYYQISMDDSVSTRDQLYGTVALRYAF